MKNIITDIYADGLNHPTQYDHFYAGAVNGNNFSATISKDISTGEMSYTVTFHGHSAVIGNQTSMKTAVKDYFKKLYAKLTMGTKDKDTRQRSVWVPIEVSNLYKRIEEIYRVKDGIISKYDSISKIPVDSEDETTYKDAQSELDKLYVIEEKIRYACVDYQNHKNG
jgi:hypothetical protein